MQHLMSTVFTHYTAAQFPVAKCFAVFRPGDCQLLCLHRALPQPTMLCDSAVHACHPLFGWGVFVSGR
jgi:hypothetical protein